jgi:hypothetical protein
MAERRMLEHSSNSTKIPKSRLELPTIIPRPVMLAAISL